MGAAAAWKLALPEPANLATGFHAQDLIMPDLNRENAVLSVLYDLCGLEVLLRDGIHLPRRSMGRSARYWDDDEIVQDTEIGYGVASLSFIDALAI